MDGPSRVAVVTGGGRGIGRGIVLAVAELGYTVVVNYRSDLGAAEATCREATGRGSPRAVPMQADIADLAEGRRLVAEAAGVAGRIDLWVNNAGIAPERRLDLLDTTPASWDRVIETNLRGPFFLTQAVAQQLLEQSASGVVAEPRVVFITSISSRFASVSRGEYCVSKAGLSMVAQLFAVRLAGMGIGVYEVRPGLIESDMTLPVRAAYDERIARGLIPAGRWGTAEDVGRAVAAIAAGAFPYSTGGVFDVDGGLSLRIF
jgi:NAD(P)-dependent dehydrogenase (short-subunit alcohol dehydrogenase family)